MNSNFTVENTSEILIIAHSITLTCNTTSDPVCYSPACETCGGTFISNNLAINMIVLPVSNLAGYVHVTFYA